MKHFLQFLVGEGRVNGSMTIPADRLRGPPAPRLGDQMVITGGVVGPFAERTRVGKLFDHHTATLHQGMTKPLPNGTSVERLPTRLDELPVGHEVERILVLVATLQVGHPRILDGLDDGHRRFHPEALPLRDPRRDLDILRVRLREP